MTINLDSTTPKRIFGNGQEARSCTPEATLAAIEPLMSQCGVTRIANITGLDRIGIPVTTAIRPAARSLVTSQGKGETLAAAKVSALMESIECWHAEFLDRPLLYDAWSSLSKRKRVIDPMQLPMRAGVAFRADAPNLWIAGVGLGDGEDTWIPYEMVSLNFVRQPGYVPAFNSGSNGLASGNSSAEAILHGLLEVIERDSTAVFNRLGRTEWKQKQVDLSAVHNPSLVALLGRLDSLDIFTAVFDLTSDIGVPTYLASVVDLPNGPEARQIPPMTGFASHLSPEVAISRAIYEAVQIRLTYISGSRDDVFASNYRYEASRLNDHLRWLSEPPASFAVREGPNSESQIFEDDLREVLNRLQKVGLFNVVVVDLTRREFGVPVVKVVVPGAEGPSRNSGYSGGSRYYRRRLS